MSYQTVFVSPMDSLYYHRIKIEQIKKSAAFAGAMADHYECLFHQRSVGPVKNLCRAAFAWFKWKHYEAEYLRLTVSELMKSLNIKSTK